MNGCDPTTAHGKELGISKILLLVCSLKKLALSNALRIIIKNRTLTLKTYLTDCKSYYYRWLTSY